MTKAKPSAMPSGPEVLAQRSKAFDLLFDAIVVTDLDGHVTDWNAGAEQLYGYSREEILGQPVSLLHDAESMEQLLPDIFAAIECEGQWHGEVKNRHKLGHSLYTESIVVPVEDADGNMIGALGINRDISERQQLAQRLQELAFRDPLTGIPNRVIGLDHLDQALAGAQRSGTQVGVLFVDLDQFKQVNDEHGHRYGDKLLRQIAERLTNAVRANDTVARIGGDEFLIVLPGLHDVSDAEHVAQKIHQLLGEPFTINDREFLISASIGIAYYPDSGDSPDTLLEAADQAMYQAKAD